MHAHMFVERSKGDPKSRCRLSSFPEWCKIGMRIGEMIKLHDNSKCVTIFHIKSTKALRVEL